MLVFTEENSGRSMNAFWSCKEGTSDTLEGAIFWCILWEKGQGRLGGVL